MQSDFWAERATIKRLWIINDDQNRSSDAVSHELYYFASVSLFNALFLFILFLVDFYLHTYIMGRSLPILIDNLCFILIDEIQSSTSQKISYETM